MTVVVIPLGFKKVIKEKQQDMERRRIAVDNLSAFFLIVSFI
jgi:hypothetical protein